MGLFEDALWASLLRDAKHTHSIQLLRTGWADADLPFSGLTVGPLNTHCIAVSHPSHNSLSALKTLGSFADFRFLFFGDKNSFIIAFNVPLILFLYFWFCFLCSSFCVF